MAIYRVELELVGNPSDGDVIAIVIPDGDPILLSFSSISHVGMVLIGANEHYTLNNIKNFFETTFNGSGVYSSWITIPSFLFEGEMSGAPTEQSGTIGDFIFIATQQTTSIAISSAKSVSAASNQCNNVDIDVVTNINTVNLLQPVVINNINSTTFQLGFQPRGINITIVVEDANNNTATRIVTTPAILNAGLVDVTVNLNNINITNSSGLVLEYSLDNSNWKSESYFANLSAGTQTLYARDIYGCTVTKSFTIDDQVGVTPTYEDYFLYPKANPLRMARVESISGCGTLKNSYNTLSCMEPLDKVVYTDKHLFLDCDRITLQMRSNYNDLMVRDPDSGTYTLNKITNNMMKKDMLDAKTINLGDSKIGVYFISGNQYDYDSGAVIGSHDYNGDLPEFIKTGTVVTVNNWNYQIEDVRYNSTVNANIFIITSTIVDLDVIVKSTYNLLDYEVYEVTIPMSGKDEFEIQIYFNGADRYVSEIVKVVDFTDQLFKIDYSMSHNTNIYFNSGFEGLIRFLVDTVKAGLKNESENYPTDNSYRLSKTEDYEVDIITFLPLTKQVSRQLILILSHDEVSINGVKYIKESIEIESLERSNLYVVIATMIVSDGNGLSKGHFTPIEIDLISYDGSNLIKSN